MGGYRGPFSGKPGVQVGQGLELRLDPKVDLADRSLSLARLLPLVGELRQVPPAVVGRETVEPAGAAGTAALLSGKVTVPAGANVLVMLSGGNIGAGAMGRLLGS